MSEETEVLTIRKYKSGRWSTLKSRRRSVKSMEWADGQRSSSAERCSANGERKASTGSMRAYAADAKGKIETVFSAKGSSAKTEKLCLSEHCPIQVVLLERGRKKNEKGNKQTNADVEATKKLFKFLWSDSDKTESSLCLT